jgi:Amt family ammonium transporter
VKYVIAIIRPERLDAVKRELQTVEVNRLTVSSASGYGEQKGHLEVYRALEYEVNLLEKIRLDIAVNDEFLEPTIEAIRKGAKTGENGAIGDGKIFVLPLENPGLALFYGGMVRRKNVLSSMMHSFVAMGVITIEWIIIGYSLAFGNGNWFIGGLDHLFLQGIDLNSTTGTIPTYAFIAFQGMFAVITPALISGALVGRIKFKSYIAFIALWGLIVYAPVCHWIWGGGFLTGEALDFAGGTVVHITSGISALAILVFLGKRKGYGVDAIKPHNVTLTLLGAGLLWFGWFGFNAGSALAADEIAGLAFMTTFIAPAAAGLAWMAVEWIHTGKPTALGLATGILVGLVSITPAAGFVTPMAAIVIGIIAGIVCYEAVMLKGKLGYDDSLDVEDDWTQGHRE